MFKISYSKDGSNAKEKEAMRWYSFLESVEGVHTYINT